MYQLVVEEGIPSAKSVAGTECEELFPIISCVSCTFVWSYYHFHALMMLTNLDIHVSNDNLDVVICYIV